MKWKYFKVQVPQVIDLNKTVTLITAFLFLSVVLAPSEHRLQLVFYHLLASLLLHTHTHTHTHTHKHTLWAQ